MGHPNIAHPSSLSASYSPHNNGNQPHDSFIQAVKEVSEWPPLIAHAADDQTEADGEDHHAQGVHPVHRPRHRNQLLVSQLLAPVEAEDGFIHRHLHHDHSVSVLRLELDSGEQ